jgi:hypothetical protein
VEWRAAAGGLRKVIVEKGLDEAPLLVGEVQGIFFIRPASSRVKLGTGY